MRRFIFLLLAIPFITTVHKVTAQQLKPIVYLIPGQGADARLYKNLQIDSTFETKHINYFTPEKDSTMHDFAKALAVNPHCRFYLLNPEKSVNNPLIY